MTDESPLFRGAPDWYYNACVNQGLAPRWAYTEGYHRAVEILAQHLADERRDLDVLVYPLIYLARHGIELRLKEVIRFAALVRGENATAEFKHSLGALWQDARVQVVELFPDDDPAQLAPVGAFVNELSRVDKASTAFRYPTDRNGEPSLDTTIRLINIRVFVEQYEEAAKLLDGIQMALGEMLEDDY